MAIPIYDPYRRQQPDVLGAVRIGLDAQLARERMMVEDARQRQLAVERERNEKRRHEQQMAQFNLQEMKANYDMQQDQPGGLNYARTMANVGQLDAAARENEAQAAYYRRRTENPEAFRAAPAPARPRVIPLTSGQINANADAAAMGQPAPYQPTIIDPADYGSAYTGANVNDPNDPALAALQASLAAGASGAPMPGEGPYVTGPAANEPASGELPAGQGINDAGLLDPSLIPPANPGPPVLAPQVPSVPLQPGDAMPIPSMSGQGQLPMDPASVARRQAMEYERIKQQASVSAALNKQKQDAMTALAQPGNENDPIAKAQKAEADRELAKLFAQAPKAEIVTTDPGPGPLVFNPATGGLQSKNWIPNLANQAPSGTAPSVPSENNSVLEQAESLRQATNPAAKDKAASQQWTAAKNAVLEGIGGREAVIVALSEGEKIKDLPDMAERIRGLLATKAKDTWYPGGSDFSEFSTNPLPPNADTLYDVANALAEDLYKEAGSKVPASKSGVTITRTK